MTRRLTAQALQPVIARAAVETAREKVSDALDIGFADFPASDLWPERVHGVMSLVGASAPAFAMAVGGDVIDEP